MMTLLQVNTLNEFTGFVGNGIVQAFGGSALLIGIAILLAIAIICFRLNVHMNTAFVFAFIALTFQKEFLNTSLGGASDIGLFGTLYNVMLLGMALITIAILNGRVNQG